MKKYLRAPAMSHRVGPAEEKVQQRVAGQRADQAQPGAQHRHDDHQLLCGAVGVFLVPHAQVLADHDGPARRQGRKGCSALKC